MARKFRILPGAWLVTAIAGGSVLAAGCTASMQPASVIPTLKPAPTFSASPPTAVPPPLSTGTPAPTLTPIPHPMSIAAMRAGSYPGSDITVEQELDPGRGYSRSYAYYLSEGLKIYGLLTVPDGEPPEGGWPAIVFNHGYIPPDVYRTTERYIAYVDRLATSGFVVYRIDYRGHDASQGEATGAYGHPGYQIDVLNAVASLKRFPEVNPDAIGMWGHSMGGYLTLRAMVISTDVKAGVIWAGVVGSYPEMLYNWRRRGPFTPSPSSRGSGWRDPWIALYGTPEQNPEYWESISATTFLQDLSGPLQLHHGTADEDVPPAFSVRLVELAREAGQVGDLYLYEGDNHNISNYFTLAMDRSIEFFSRYLKPDQ